jgi:hypothetical protein
MSHPTVRLGNGSSMRSTKLRRVNLSPENRFEASALRGNSTAAGAKWKRVGRLSNRVRLFSGRRSLQGHDPVGGSRGNSRPTASIRWRAVRLLGRSRRSHNSLPKRRGLVHGDAVKDGLKNPLMAPSMLCRHVKRTGRWIGPSTAIRLAR